MIFLLYFTYEVGKYLMKQALRKVLFQNKISVKYSWKNYLIYHLVSMSLRNKDSFRSSVFSLLTIHQIQCSYFFQCKEKKF